MADQKSLPAVLIHTVVVLGKVRKNFVVLDFGELQSTKHTVWGKWGPAYWTFANICIQNPGPHRVGPPVSGTSGERDYRRTEHQ